MKDKIEIIAEMKGSYYYESNHTHLSCIPLGVSGLLKKMPPIASAITSIMVI